MLTQERLDSYKQRRIQEQFERVESVIDSTLYFMVGNDKSLLPDVQRINIKEHMPSIATSAALQAQTNDLIERYRLAVTEFKFDLNLVEENWLLTIRRV